MLLPGTAYDARWHAEVTKILNTNTRLEVVAKGYMPAAAITVGDPQVHYAALHVEQDEKKNKKRKRKILKKKRKTKRLPRAVDDSARGQRPRKRRPKA